MPPSRTPHELRASRIKAIGHVLRVRRTALDPAHHHKRDGWVQTVKKETGLVKPERTIIDLETGARIPDPDRTNSGYRASTLASMEKAYRLRPGSLTQALWGGDLVTEDGEILYPPHEPDCDPDPDRFVTEHRRDEATGRVISLVHDLQEQAQDTDSDEARTAMQRRDELTRSALALVQELEELVKGTNMDAAEAWATMRRGLDAGSDQAKMVVKAELRGRSASASSDP